MSDESIWKRTNPPDYVNPEGREHWGEQRGTGNLVLTLQERIERLERELQRCGERIQGLEGALRFVGQQLAARRHPAQGEDSLACYIREELDD